MTCGKWMQKGHEAHICTGCVNMFSLCEASCRLAGTCNFSPATTEILEIRRIFCSGWGRHEIESFRMKLSLLG